MMIPTWVLPVAAMTAVWGWAFLMPLPEAKGSYGFEPAFAMMFRLVVAVTVTLTAWLIFFAAKVAAA
jgi:hypothetical protein